MYFPIHAVTISRDLVNIKNGSISIQIVSLHASTVVDNKKAGKTIHVLEDPHQLRETKAITFNLVQHLLKRRRRFFGHSFNSSSSSFDTFAQRKRRVPSRRTTDTKVVSIANWTPWKKGNPQVCKNLDTALFQTVGTAMSTSWLWRNEENEKCWISNNVSDFCCCFDLLREILKNFQDFFGMCFVLLKINNKLVGFTMFPTERVNHFTNVNWTNDAPESHRFRPPWWSDCGKSMCG